MSKYLDTEKSVIISSPAGSGKTEKLARRYIALLKKGVEVERILAITFTDKASAEMKQRILRILKDEDREMFRKLLEKISLMRVSTIHSFCGTLLRRFSFEVGIEPNYRIEEALDCRITWEEILYEILMEAGEKVQRNEWYKLILQTISEKGFRGLEELKDIINYLYEKSPFSLEAEISHLSPPTSYLSIIEELRDWPGAENAIKDYKGLFDDDKRIHLIERYFLTENKEPRKKAPQALKEIVDFQGWSERMYLYWRNKNVEEHSQRAQRIKNIFKRCYLRYKDKKGLRGILDFSDLEYLAYRLLTESPEWANILYAFDERTDHILVDEFQDINNFQWSIIDKLTEEWRSGMGPKREEGIKPTIFLVGDEKQSIYFFRGANVELFGRAREKLREWLGEEFYYEEAKENFRSLPAIIDFTNHLFSRIMTATGQSPSWMTRYSPFNACREAPVDKGRVEVILLDEGGCPVSVARQREAEVIAKRIRSLVGSLQVFDRKTNQQRHCRYMDMAILLRKRTHLKKYEEALRGHGIPFVTVKGIGFYQEPEVAMLRAFIYFLSNPKDDYSLYVLLKGPLFLIDEAIIIKAINTDGNSLFSRLKAIDGAKEAVMLLEEWLRELPYTPIGELIEKALVRTKAWRYFYEAQRMANVKKFIRIIEDLEAKGKSLIKIRDFLERTFNKDEEPKANVNTEGMDAVRIMTIHASKGLEFPIVFIPALEEPFTLRTGDSLIYESAGRLFFKYEPEGAIRKTDNDFLLHLKKEIEEQKRLFYVAVTRAEDALFLVGHWNNRDDNNFLSFLKQGLGLKEDEAGYKMDAAIDGLSILSGEEVRVLYENTPKPRAKEELRVKSLEFRETPNFKFQTPQWRVVTEVVDIRRKHGRDWVTLGDVFHRIFEEISKGIIDEADIRLKTERLLTLKGIFKDQRERLLSIIEKDIALLKQRGIWQEIILPKEDSYSELPFILEVKHKSLTPNSELKSARGGELRTPNLIIYTGRIDRVIIKDGLYNIYDYKTFPVSEGEMDYLLREYSFQLGIYRRAIKRLFKAKKVRSFIVFTHIGEVKEV